MKKRLLMVVPVIALLASCGSDPMDAVRKSLPGDVAVVDPGKVDQDVIDEYISDAFEEMFYSLEYKAVYNLSVDLSFSVNGTNEAGTFSGSSRIKGDITLGYDMVLVEDVAYSSIFLKVSGLTVESNLKLPDAMKEEMPIPESISIRNVDFYAYAFESELGAYAYVDLSNHSLQDYAKTALSLSGIKQEEIDGMLDSLLGEKIEGTEYRPGLAEIDLTDLFTQIDQAKTAQGAEPASEDDLEHPISLLLDLGDSGVEDIKTGFNEMVSDILPALSPVVGVKYSDEGGEVAGLEKTSIVMNVSSSQVAEAIGIPADQMPVQGVAGLLVTVGMDKGSEMYCLEELSLSANVSGNIEGVSFSFNGSVSLTATYNEEATMVTLTEEEMKTYSPITDELAGLIIGLM